MRRGRADFLRGSFIGEPLLALHDKHAHARGIRGDLLHARLGRRGLLPGGDPSGAVQPRAGRPADVLQHLRTTPAVQAHDVALLAGSEQFDILGRHHPAIAHEHDAPEPESRLQIHEHGLHGRGVAPIALEHVMRNRPAVDHHDAHQDLAVAGLAVPTVPVLGQCRWPVPLEVRRCQIVEDQVHVQRKQRP
jgi:hypothetical protein